MTDVDLMAQPFDQYQRYMAIAQIVDQVRGHLGRPRLRALDVGGFFRNRQGRALLPLAQFLPHDHVFAVDLVAECLADYALASGLSLPFPDRAFDIVINCDTLEHVPLASRLALVDELLRVARHYTIVAGPFDSPLTRQAERILHEYIVAQGGYNRELQEHLARPLPALNELYDHLRQRSLEVVSFADGYLPHWLAMMLIKHTPGQSLDFHLELDRLYNRHFSACDRREPAYRDVLIVAQPGNEALLPTIAETFRPVDVHRPVTNLDLAADLVGLLHLSQPLDLIRTVQQMNDQLAEAHSRLAALDKENARLRRLVSGYEQGRFIRLMRWISDWRAGLRRGKQ
jgi:SAM-dependent methyltransferase